MASVDNRVVEMQFDNAAFERRISTTIQSLEKLQKSLDLANAKRGLEDVSKASKSFNLGGMASAVDGISAKFLALSTIAVTTLANITNRAVNAGIDIAKSLSLDQVISGFREYELNMRSIQTILSNTKADGTNLEQVSGALDELNTYADKTIYNFGEMARNIGTFSAAGVDLDTSVQSIKGIANLAAISGSSSQQASTAMYQLSQAISTGTLRLMDWNSVVNAGMGGEVFQKALFETGKAMGTIKDIDMATTFEEWTSGGNSFRSSLEQNWLTGEVLTNTLKGFTGEMTEAQLTAIGYTKEQAAEIIELGETGVEAATKVRTLTQLIDTVKESIGSGWSQSFRIIFGDFEEATELFTGLSDAIGAFVGKNADARNNFLSSWANFGGRDNAIAGLKNLFEALVSLMDPIRKAFREFFPPVTVEQALKLTTAFMNFTESLKLGELTSLRVQRIFRGFFAALEIGWEIIKQGTGFIKDLFVEFSGAGSGGFLKFMASIGDFFVDLNKKLIDGGGITKFFTALGEAIRDPLGFLDELKNKIEEVWNILAKGDFTGISGWQEDSSIVDFLFDLRERLLDLIPDSVTDGIEKLGGAFDRLEQRFETLKNIAEKIGDIWGPVSDKLNGVKDVLEEVWTYIRDWFANLGGEMAAAAEPGDFDAVVDVVNVGLLGGIALILKKFLTNGLDLNLGGGVIKSISETLGQLSGVLQAMQTDIKANALLKIAGAVGILTASVLVLSLIDSAALSKALTAMAVGFGQLLGAFAILTKLSLGPTSAAQFVVIATGITVLSGALLLLAFAVKVMSSLNWEELAKGLSAVVALLGALTATVQLMSGNTGGMVRAGIGILFIAVAMNVLAAAMKIFATMSWEEIAKGLAGVAGGLIGISLAMNLLPDKARMFSAGAGILLIGVGLLAIAGAAKIFATMSWEEIGKGLAGIAGGLIGIALAMKLMPASLPLIGVGLLLVSGALLVISEVMKQMASLSWEELGRGLAGMAGSLGILAAALFAMGYAAVGALALVVASGGLLLLAKAVEAFAGLSWGEMLKGMVGLAATLGVLAGAAVLLGPAIVPMLALGAALLLLGAGFALFGVGANLTARAFKVLASAGEAGIKVLLTLIDSIVSRIPALAAAFATGLLEVGMVFLEGAPVLIEQLGVVLAQMLETLIMLLPDAFEAVSEIISGLLQLIQDKAPEFAETGFSILVALLEGLRNNIGEITTLVAEIIVGFMDAFAAEVPGLVSSLVNLLTVVFEEVARGLGELAPSLFVGVGISLLEGLWEGVSKQAVRLKDLFLDFINGIVNWVKSGFGISSPSTVFMEIGKNLMEGLYNGVIAAAKIVNTWFVELPGKVIAWVGNVTGTLVSKGWDILFGFLKGVGNFATNVLSAWFIDLPLKVFRWVGNVADTLIDKGWDIVSSFFTGVGNFVRDVLLPYFADFGNKVKKWIGDTASWLIGAGEDIIRGLLKGLDNMKDRLINKAEEVAGWVTSPLEKAWGWLSPARLFIQAGHDIGRGLIIGLDNMNRSVEGSSESLGQAAINGVSNALRTVSENLSMSDEFNPTITPVLNLDNVRAGAATLAGLVSGSTFSTGLSYAQANDIASTRTEIDTGSSEGEFGAREVKFEQNIYAPEQLSTGDIYRQTKNQITLAKEELAIA